MKDEPNDTLARLRELTERVAPFDSLFGLLHEGRVDLVVNHGSAYVLSLLKIPGIALCNCHFEPNTEMAYHKHSEIEVLIVYSGTFHTNPGGVVVTLKAGETFRTGINAIHKAWTTDEPCDLIAITIPASSGYPDVC